MRVSELKFLTAFLCLSLLCLPVRAQFYNDGTDDASIRWKELQTSNYRIIFPHYADSLALQYAASLEKYTPKGLPFKKKLPVVMHTENAFSNGSVAWAPSRMELYTVPDSYSPLSLPWKDNLSVHEVRHYYQMFPGYDRKFLAGRILFGEFWPFAIGAIYPSTTFMEGDAVLYETAMTSNGRGRQASFLEYYHACFAAGDKRDFWKWKYGSNRYFTPDHYRAGYLQIAGPSALYNEPNLAQRYFDRIIEKPWLPFDNFNKTVKEISGKNFKTVWKEVCDSLSGEWAQWDAQRAPFQDAVQLTGNLRRYTSYDGLAKLDGRLYAIRQGIDRTPELVEIDSCGKVRRIHSFSSSSQGLENDDIYHRLVWTEIVPNTRWEMKSYSVVKYYGQDGSIGSLTRASRYFGIDCCKEEALYAVIEYPVEGGSRAVILNPGDGSVIESIDAPRGYELTSLAWVGKKLFAVANSAGGAGIYNLTDRFLPLIENIPSSINGLRSYKGNLRFVCDCSGVNELYSINISDGRIFQLSTTRFGGSNWEEDGESFFFTQPGKDGQNIYSTRVSNIREIENLNYERVSFLVPDSPAGTSESNCDTTEFKIRNYSKFGHLIRFHSWIPLFIDADAVESLSFSTLTTTAGLGATAFFQNELGSASGLISYHAQPTNGKWQHSGHLKFNYSGWYPVFELSADLNDRNSLIYQVEKTVGEKYTTYRIIQEPTSKPLIAGTLSAYIPFKINSRGLSRGIIPEVRYSVTNDILYGKNLPMQRLSLSLRGYIMQPVASSCIYPRYGIGLEVGSSMRPGLTDIFAGNAFAYIYGYLPGILRTHGLKLTATLNSHTGNGIFSESYVSLTPRGFAQDNVSGKIARYGKQAKFTVDYALPFGNADWSFLCPVAYIRNFELILHSDCTIFHSPADSGALMSAGADLQVVLGNLLWIPYNTRIGVTYNYKTGPSFGAFSTPEAPISRNYVGALFSVDF